MFDTSQLISRKIHWCPKITAQLHSTLQISRHHIITVWQSWAVLVTAAGVNKRIAQNVILWDVSTQQRSYSEMAAPSASYFILIQTKSPACRPKIHLPHPAINLSVKLLLFALDKECSSGKNIWTELCLLAWQKKKRRASEKKSQKRAPANSCQVVMLTCQAARYDIVHGTQQDGRSRPELGCWPTVYTARMCDKADRKAAAGALQRTCCRPRAHGSALVCWCPVLMKAKRRIKKTTPC